jgi:hypothetical protein
MTALAAKVTTQKLTNLFLSRLNRRFQMTKAELEKYDKLTLVDFIIRNICFRMKPAEVKELLDHIEKSIKIERLIKQSQAINEEIEALDYEKDFDKWFSLHKKWQRVHKKLRKQFDENYAL